MCLFWTLPVVVHQELLPPTKQGSPGLESRTAQLFLRQGQSHGMELDMGREMHRAGLQQLQQHIRFSRALKQMSLVLALASRAAELGHCWRFWKFFAGWAGNSKRNVVVSLRLSQREELSSGLCSLVDVLHLCKSSHCITGLGMTILSIFGCFAVPAPLLIVCKGDSPQGPETWNLCVMVPYELDHPTWLLLDCMEEQSGEIQAIN